MANVQKIRERFERVGCCHSNKGHDSPVTSSEVVCPENCSLRYFPH